MLMTTQFDVEVETVDRYLDKVGNLVGLVYGTFSSNVRAQLTRDFFLHGLPCEVKKQVAQSRCDTLETTVNATKMAFSLQNSLDKGTVSPVVVDWKSPPIRQQRAKRDQYSETRNGSECSEVRKPRGCSIRCYRCQGWGHMARVCPSQSMRPKKPAHIEELKTSEDQRRLQSDEDQGNGE